MRKYIHKFKNYTSVEVDNLHDLKEGDLALYEDKFVTRNNGKVEEVVKGSGGSSEDEYSTDYPDDFYFEWIGDSSIKRQTSFKEFNGTSVGNFPSMYSDCALTTGEIANVLHIHIENLNPKSVRCIFTLPEADVLPSGHISAYPLNETFPENIFITNKSICNKYTIDSNSDLLLISKFWHVETKDSLYSFMHLYFETKDGKKYKVCGVLPINASYSNNKTLPRYYPNLTSKFLTLNTTLDLV